MMRPVAAAVATAAVLVLAACHPVHNSPTTVTADQDRELNAAAATLDPNDSAARPPGRAR